MIDTEWSPQISLCCTDAPTVAVTLSRPQPDTTVCTITGAFNWNTIPLVRSALADARQNDNAHLLIDLSAVTLMDSAGPYTLLEARFKYQLSGGSHLALIADPNSAAIPELHMVALQASFDVHPTLAEGLHACANVDTGICP